MKPGMAYLVNVASRPAPGATLCSFLTPSTCRHSDAAVKWYKGLKEAILSLEEQPETPKNVKLRHLLYGHKPHIYRVKTRNVHVRYPPHGCSA